jgi:hypothetical protein
MAEVPSQAHSLMRSGEGEFDLAEAARVLAPILDVPRANLQQQLAERPGVFAQGVPEPVAAEAVASLRHTGIEAVSVPDSEVVHRPATIEVKRGRVLDDGFQFRHRGQDRIAPWGEIVFFDAASVQLTEQVVESEREPIRTDDRPTYRDVAYQRVKASWEEFLDVVCYEPWVHLRIAKDSFHYAQAGIPAYASSTKSFLALVIAFKTRCDPAGEGPGVGLLFDGKARTRQRVPSMRMYDNLLMWRLTLRFREAT